MDFERQKPVTDAYRKGYIRTFRAPQKTELEIGDDGSITAVTTVYSNGRIFSDKRAMHSPSAGRGRCAGEDDQQYPNGCPILEERTNA